MSLLTKAGEGLLPSHLLMVAVKSKVNTLVASLDDTLIIRIQGLQHSKVV